METSNTDSSILEQGLALTDTSSISSSDDISSISSSLDTSCISSSVVDNGDWVKYIPLYRAVLKADWKKAEEIINKDKDALTARIERVGGQTALHVALAFSDVDPKNTLFVNNLLKYISPKSLETLLDGWQYNALHRAAIAGYTQAARMLVDINPYLLFCRGKLNRLPIHSALYNSQKPTFIYLLEACKKHIGLCKEARYYNPFEGSIGAKLLNRVILAGYLDSAYELIRDYPDLATTKGVFGLYPLAAIAGKPDAYLSGKHYNFYQRFVYSYVPINNDDLHDTQKIQDIEKQDAHEVKFAEKYISNNFYTVFQKIYNKIWEVALLRVSHIKHLQEDKVKHKNTLKILKCICEAVDKMNNGSDIFEIYGTAFNEAVTYDIYEAVKEISEHFPLAVWIQRSNYKIIQIAILHRCEKVYSFLVHTISHGVAYQQEVCDKHGNSLLHLAGKLAPIHKLNRVSGAALQMQMELQWFEAVTKFSHPTDKEKKNNKKETPMIKFKRKHETLRKQGEEWMKKTSDSCTTTAALIITIVFAAAITVPGGNDGGRPIYETKPSFIIFAIADAISLFSSTTSLLLFLSILTARYQDEDFLHSLPNRLILGLGTLFLSVTSMLVAFSATLYITFGQGKGWVLIPIATLTCLPIASFVTLQLPLLVDLISSTYGKGIFANGVIKGSSK